MGFDLIGRIVQDGVGDVIETKPDLSIAPEIDDLNTTEESEKRNKKGK